jgi:hypothetical protein
MYTAVKNAARKTGNAAIVWVQEAEQEWSSVESLRECDAAYQLLDSALSDAIQKIVPANTRFARRLEQLQILENREHQDVLNGRQKLYEMYEHLSMTDDLQLVNSITDLTAVKFEYFGDKGLPNFRDSFFMIANHLPADVSESVIAGVLLEELRHSQVLHLEIARYRNLPTGHREKTLASLRRILDNQIKLDDKDFNRLKFMHDISGSKGKGKANKANSAPKDATPAAPGVAQSGKGRRARARPTTPPARRPRPSQLPRPLQRPRGLVAAHPQAATSRPPARARASASPSLLRTMISSPRQDQKEWTLASTASWVPARPATTAPDGTL